MRARLAAFLHRRSARRIQRQMMRHQIRRLGLQILILASLMFVGVGLLHPKVAAPVHLAHGMPLPALSPTGSETGRGAGNSAAAPGFPSAPALCNPFDPNCYANAIGGWMAGALLSGLQPITDFFQNSSLNILTQTPPDDSYANSMVWTINQDLVHAVDVALACLLLIGGYNVILGHHLRIARSSVSELLPRAILVTCAVHFNLFFIGLFIDLNNALCNTVMAVGSYQTLTNMIAGFLSINPFAGLMLVLLIIIVAILAVLLFVQMVTRIALVALLVAVAPLGLACLALPQSMRWGRLWFTAFSSAVLVQFLQVTALTLGGLLITSMGNTAFWHLGHQLVEVFLAIGMMVVTLKIPGMLQTWALHPMMTANSELTDLISPSNNGGGGGSNSSETAATVAELLALL